VELWALGKIAVDKSGNFTNIGTMSGTKALLSVARAYADKTSLKLSTVSSRALKDGKKLGAVVSGAGITVKRLERTMRWFSDNWPSDTAWPEDVPRPERETSPESVEEEAHA
jgi:hypothetical protein